jgi:hypothetical protein
VPFVRSACPLRGQRVTRGLRMAAESWPLQHTWPAWMRRSVPPPTWSNGSANVTCLEWDRALDADRERVRRAVDAGGDIVRIPVNPESPSFSDNCGEVLRIGAPASLRL